MPTLVVGPNWVGDMIMAHGLISYLKSKRPDDPIHMLAPSWSLEVARRMPEVDQVIELPFDHGELKLKERWAFARKLRFSRYHRAFVLPNSLKSALIPAMAGIPRRIGWRGEYRYKLLTDLRILHEARFPRMIDRYMALGFPANLALSANQLPEAPLFPRLTMDEASQANLVSNHGLDPARLVALCPGAEFGPAKQWPLDRFSDLATRLIDAGHQVILLGSPNDADDVERLIDQVAKAKRKSLVNLAGLTSIPEAVDLIGLSKAVVTHDSGLMHVAAATGRPLVALFGPSSPAHTPPLSDTAVTLTHPVPCHPCFERECPLTHQACLSELSVDEVFEALLQQIQRIA
ncbi:MAG: lipopolysaccharide heptosyltransferase II [Gammaproteobacteria bacterium]|jgi:heptosyltransferase-2|nr:lipopolysaccharide heptosyltransferase II [Gammaproteobacteria bacterium]